MLNQQIHSLKKAAEKHFRKALKRQQRLTVWEVSEESEVEIVSVKDATNTRHPFEGTFVPDFDNNIARSLNPPLLSSSMFYKQR